MVDVDISRRYSDNPKAIVKHASKKARRRQDLARVVESMLASVEDTIEITVHHEPEPDRRVAAAVLVWDDGLDYNMDGTAYQDDAPGEWPHSYHNTVEDAEAMVARLVARGLDPRRISLVRDYWVLRWDTDRIPD